MFFTIEDMKHIRHIAALIVLVMGLAISAAQADQRLPFDQWLVGVRTEALAQGISPALVTAALTDITPIQKIMELDKKQPEFTQSFASYYAKRVNDARIQQGRRMLNQHADELEKASAQYGVAPHYIVALWGMETNYGGFTGGHNVIPALATLAWDGRGGTAPSRAAYFRKELLTALKIIDEGHISLEGMQGSWAGAMGQVQFMPTSFARLAVDGDGDGRRDIWTNLPDAFASAANYLARNGWADGQRWGRRVALPTGFSETLIGPDAASTLSVWQGRGVRLHDGGPIPVVEGMKAHIVAPDGLSGPAYLVYTNFGVIKRWNNSDKYALSVGLLADAIAPALPDGS